MKYSFKRFKVEREGFVLGRDAMIHSNRVLMDCLVTCGLFASGFPKSILALNRVEIIHATHLKWRRNARLHRRTAVAIAAKQLQYHFLRPKIHRTLLSSLLRGIPKIKNPLEEECDLVRHPFSSWVSLARSRVEMWLSSVLVARLIIQLEGK